MPAESKLFTDHPDEVLTASYLERTLGEEAREALEAHFADCDSCRASIVLLSGAVEAAGAESKEESVPPEILARAMRGAGPFPHRTGRVGSLAVLTGIAAVILIVVGLTVWRGLGPDVPQRSGTIAEYRGDEEGPFGFVSPARGATIAARDLAFSWSAVDGADRYVVTVLGPDGAVRATIDVPASDLRAAWPSELSSPAPGSLLWKVRAMSLDRTLAETRVIPFEVR